MNEYPFAEPGKVQTDERQVTIRMWSSSVLNRARIDSQLMDLAKLKSVNVAPQMMKTYSHVRRLALDQVAAALEPTSLSPKREAELVN